jgi:hypothetical protein
MWLYKPMLSWEFGENRSQCDSVHHKSHLRMEAEEEEEEEEEEVEEEEGEEEGEYGNTEHTLLPNLTAWNADFQ